jgi:outer membrane protein OmpA-like peptidoglycan-associated protein
MKTARTSLACAALIALVAIGLSYGVTAGEKVKTSGLITGRSGEDLTVKTSDMGNIVVVLTDDTKIEQPKGLLKVRKQQMGVTALVPGLSVEVEGVGDAGGRVTASKIKFSKESLKMANQIQAGLTPTNEEVQANRQSIEANKGAIASNQSAIASNASAISTNQQDIQATNKRFSDLDDYNTKESVTLYYGVGASELSEKQKTELAQLAQKATGLQGYLVQVAGYTDSSGNAAYNQELSQERAQNVIAYLQQTGNIPLLHIVAPGAMGETDPAGSNESAQGRAENRRVVVKVLVNKGMAEH